MSAFDRALNFVAGRNVVNNATNPASAYSMQKRAKPTLQNAQTKVTQQALSNEFKGKNRVYGASVK